MKIKHPLPLAISVSMILITILSCAAPTTGQPSPTATPTPGGANDIVGAGGNAGGNAGGGNGGNSGGGDSGGNGGSNNPGGNTIPNPNLPPDVQTTSYAVVQTMTLGGESISGGVCSLTQPFTVSFTTPKVAFVTAYVPTSASQGTWTYAYDISSAGETHNASGSYTISPPSPDGSLVLTMTGKDNVAFKGFSGPIPTHYSFKLVPSSTTPCPTLP